MYHLLLAATLAMPNISGRTQQSYRVMAPRTPGTRFIRMHANITINGIAGTEIATYDLATGRYVQRISAGLLSTANGFDGSRVWSSDATGMPLLEGNAKARAATYVEAHFYGRSGGERYSIRHLGRHDGVARDELDFAVVPGPIVVSYTIADRRIVEIVDRSIPDRPNTMQFSDYRVLAGVALPRRVETTDRHNQWIERVTGATALEAVPPSTFAPPARPDDVTLVGTATVPLYLDEIDRPVVKVKINGGPVLRMLFDTGGANSLTPEAAQRLGLVTLPAGREEEPGVAPHPVQIAAVQKLTIGRAELRHQTFSIDSAYFGRGLDGSIGCEVLQRFAVRFDFLGRTLKLSRDVTAVAPRVASTPMHLAGCQPEVDGGFDEFNGPFGIDTGSHSIDIMAPFVRAHGLIRRYRAIKSIYPVAKNPEALLEYGAFVPSFRLGSARFQMGGYGMPITLQTRLAGPFADSTQVGNVGTIFFLLFDNVTFDYRSGRVWITSRHLIEKAQHHDRPAATHQSGR